MPQFCVGRPLSGNPPPGVPHHMLKLFDSRSIAWSGAFGVTTGVAVALLLLVLHPDSLPLGSPSWPELLLASLVLTIGHEALHLLGFPHFGLGRHTVIGLWIELGAPFVQHLAPMSRERFLCAAAMPFLVLTALPVVLIANGIGPVDLLSWIAVLNCVGAGSDLLVIMRTSRVVPPDAWVVENGETLLWGRA